MSDIPTRFNRRLTPGFSRRWKRERRRSGRCKRSAAHPGSAQFGRDVGLLSQPHGTEAHLTLPPLGLKSLVFLGRSYLLDD